MKNAANVPVILTGRVFVHGALEDDFPYLRLSRVLQAGDMRVHAHLDAEGRRKRACGHCQAGYSGVLRASVYDGRHWRKFMLALEVDVEDRHFTQFAYRAGRAQLVIRRISLLKGMTCSWRDGAYVVNRHTTRARANNPAANAPKGPAGGKTAGAIASSAAVPVSAQPPSNFAGNEAANGMAATVSTGPSGNGLGPEQSAEKAAVPALALTTTATTTSSTPALQPKPETSESPAPPAISTLACHALARLQERKPPRRRSPRKSPPSQIDPSRTQLLLEFD